MPRKVVVKNAIDMIESGKINESYFSDNLVVEGLRPKPINKEEYLDFLCRMTQSFPDLCYNCKQIIEKNNNTVAAKVKLTGTNKNEFNVPDYPPHPATGKKFVLPQETIEYEVNLNKISKIKVNGSRMNEIVEQLGINPFLC